MRVNRACQEFPHYGAMKQLQCCFCGAARAVGFGLGPASRSGGIAILRRDVGDFLHDGANCAATFPKRFHSDAAKRSLSSTIFNGTKKKPTGYPCRDRKWEWAHHGFAPSRESKKGTDWNPAKDPGPAHPKVVRMDRTFGKGRVVRDWGQSILEAARHWGLGQVPEDGTRRRWAFLDPLHRTPATRFWGREEERNSGSTPQHSSCQS